MQWHICVCISAQREGGWRERERDNGERHGARVNYVVEFGGAGWTHPEGRMDCWRLTIPELPPKIPLLP